jgi:hypothetical protein
LPAGGRNEDVDRDEASYDVLVAHTIFHQRTRSSLRRPQMIKPRRTHERLSGKTVGPEPAADLKRRADRISSLIVASDYPDVDIDIEIRNLREWCQTHIPERMDLFELIYVNRFQRLREQFRG